MKPKAPLYLEQNAQDACLREQIRREICEQLGLNPDKPPALMDDGQTATVLNISPKTLPVWRVRGYPNLPWVRYGGRTRYRLTDIADFLAERRQGSSTTWKAQ